MTTGRAAHRTFKPGDTVTVRRVVKSGKHTGCRLEPGAEGIVESMEQQVRVRFPQFPRTIWVLYDGDLVHVGKENA